MSNKAVKFAANATFAVGSGLLTVAAWGAANAFMDVPAPITWLCVAFWGFCCVAYTGVALAAPFAKE